MKKLNWRKIGKKLYHELVTETLIDLWYIGLCLTLGYYVRVAIMTYMGV